MKKFDYYIFIDYSVNIIGYVIIDERKLFELVPLISKFSHYKDLKNKNTYIHSIKKIISKNNILDFFLKHKIKEIRQNMEIYMDVFDFIKKHDNCIIFIFPLFSSSLSLSKL